MSWAQYHEYLTANNGCAVALIVGAADGGLWTSSNNQGLSSYNTNVPLAEDPDKHQSVSVNEWNNLKEALGNKGVTKSPAGLRIQNEKFYTVSFDSEPNGLTTWYLKKEKGSAAIVQTKSAVIVAVFSQVQGQNAGEVNKRIGLLGKQLLDVGY